jgi:hypothetical protein
MRSHTMDRFDGTAARQLTLMDLDEPDTRELPDQRRVRASQLRLLRHDVFAELTRRRRRAQIAARHLIEDRAGVGS